MSFAAPPSMDMKAARRWARLRPEDSGKEKGSPWLHEEVARRMQERLDWIKLQPQSWINWEPLRGGLAAHQTLSRRYPKAPGRIVEATPEREKAAKTLTEAAWWHPRRWLNLSDETVAGKGSPADMLWANMGLHMNAQPQVLLAQWHSALATNGFLMFSCLGPDTLLELRALFSEMGWPAPAHEFTDMHDWGDMLVQAGFAEPVMDMERITLTFDTPQRLLAELRLLGRNLNVDRHSGLRGRQWLAALQDALSHRLPRLDGRLSLTFEVIYGHALKAASKLKIQPEITVSMDQMRESLTRGRRR